MEAKLAFQYPEGFLPDSDYEVIGDNLPNRNTLFQYPEGFLPDSDRGLLPHRTNSEPLSSIVSVPRRVFAR